MRTRNLFALLCLVGGAVAAMLGVLPPPAIEPAEPTPPPEPTRAFGWIDDPEAVRECTWSLQCWQFCDTEAYSAPETGPDDVFLWEACREVTGDVLPPRDQKSVGACVGFATAAAIEHLMCVQIAEGAWEEFRELSPEVIYGGSRVQVGGGRVRGDGSVGAWAAKFVTDYGVVPRDQYGKFDLRTYNEARCRELGRIGVPADLQALAKEHPVKGVANVRTWDECKAAIRNGYPMLVCSSQGFGMERDADGFCPPRGVWYHAMAVVGVRGGKRPGGFLLNSWGPTAHSGPRLPPDAPVAGFWVEAVTLDRMVRQGDSWAFSRVAGFPLGVGSGQWTESRGQ